MLCKFVAPDGTSIERELSRDELMDLPLEGGSLVLREGGKTYKRARPSLGGVVPHLDYDHDQYPKVSRTLPQWCAGADHVQSGPRAGMPIITSRRHQDQLCQRFGYTRDY